MLRQDDAVKAQLVFFGWREGREYGGHLAAVMVMSVLANRVRAGWGTWLDVLDHVPKYSATREQATGTPNLWEPNFVRLLHEVEAIYDGSKDYVKGALYWCDTRRVETEFFKSKILKFPDEHPRVADINTLTFFQ